MSEEIQALRAELDEVKQRLRRLELFAGYMSRETWQRAKTDAESGESTVIAGPNLPRLPVRIETLGIGADKNLR